MTLSATDSLWNDSLLAFHERAGAATPTPGGGAVAAVTATFAAGLLRMVGAICVRSKPDAQIEAVIACVNICEAKLAQYADDDMRAFDAYMAARKNCKTLAPKKLQELLLVCASVPPEAVEQVEKLQSLAAEIAPKCPAFLASDIAIARHLLHAGRESLMANVAINCNDLDDCEEKRVLQQRLDRLLHPSNPV